MSAAVGAGAVLLAAALAGWPVRDAVSRRVPALLVRGRLVRPASRRVHPSLRRLGGGAAVAAAGAALGLLAVRSPVLAAAVAVAGVAAVRIARARWSDRVAARRARLVARVIGLLRTELEAGASVEHALRGIAAGLGADGWADARSLGRALDAAAAGRDPAVTLLAGPGWSVAALHPLAGAWRVSRVSGTSLAAVLARVHADALDRVALGRERAQALAGPRASAMLLAVLPVVGLALGQAVGARPAAVLLTTTGGQLLAAGGVLLAVAGLLWTERLLRS